MNSFAETIRKYLGWCPMAAAAQQEQGGLVTAEEPGTGRAADAGPVARRAVLFCQMSLAVVALAWIAAFAALPHLPETIPVHWNIYGEADGFAGRIFGAFTLPAIMTLVLSLLVVIPRYDRVRAASDDSRDIYAIIVFATVTLLFGIETAALVSSAGMNVPVGAVFPVLLGFFFIVIGGLLPHLRRNTTAGIRLPWTVGSERVWDETHRRGGPVFVAAGVLMVLSGVLAGSFAMPLSLLALAAAIIYITAWSYRLSRNYGDVEKEH